MTKSAWSLLGEYAGPGHLMPRRLNDLVVSADAVMFVDNSTHDSVPMLAAPGVGGAGHP